MSIDTVPPRFFRIRAVVLHGQLRRSSQLDQRAV